MESVHSSLKRHMTAPVFLFEAVFFLFLIPGNKKDFQFDILRD